VQQIKIVFTKKLRAD